MDKQAIRRSIVRTPPGRFPIDLSLPGMDHRRAMASRRGSSEPGLSRRAPARRDEAPDHQHDDGTDHGADQAGAFVGAIPADRLAEIGRQERADDAEDRGEDAALRFVVAGVRELGDDARDEADDDGPDDVHGGVLLLHRRTGSAAGGSMSRTAAYARGFLLLA